MTIPVWTPGTLYNPGALVIPATTPAIVQSAPTNGSFEEGDTGWDKDAGWTIGQYGQSFGGGTWSAQWNATGTAGIRNNNVVPVGAGDRIKANCAVQQGASSAGQAGAAIILLWLDDSMAQISNTVGNVVDSGSGSEWKGSEVNGIAPAGAAFVQIQINAFRNSGGSPLWVDYVIWDYTYAAPPEGLIYKAVQADAGFSGGTEPTWPQSVGLTVVDNQVTWEAIVATRVVWEASPILVSGSTEPTWPTSIGGTIADNTIVWKAVTRQIEDAKCPQSDAVAIAASKVFAVDDDIIRYSATVNPLDWSTIDDAGYLPFGLQTLGSNPARVLGLYRSNLVAFNAEGFQMWQVDQDPASMAFLDAVPVGSTYAQAQQPLANDLIFLNDVGVRNIAIAGASTNLQADAVGQPIDSLVRAKIAAGEFTPTGLYYPAMGQYWLFFGDEAFVLTINGAKKKSWSRYVFPEEITYWTLHGNDLYLRTAEDHIWRVDQDAVADDVTTGGVSLIVAVGEAEESGESVQTSPDATAWTDIDPGNADAWYGITYAAELGLYVAVGYSSSTESEAIMTSPDASTWVLRDPDVNAGGSLEGIVWVSELGLLVATGEVVTTSPDGITWTSRGATPGQEYFSSVAWSPSLELFVATAGYSASVHDTMTSTDGINWTGGGLISTAGLDWGDVVWAEELGLFVTGSDNVEDNGVDDIATSPDGTTWTLRSSGITAITTGMVAIAWSPTLGLLAAVGFNGFLATSSDGVNWTQRTGSTDRAWQSVIWAEGIGFVAMANFGGFVMTSADGVTWTQAGITNENYMWALVSASGAASSTPFPGIIQWPYLDLGAPGIDKNLIGFDLTTTAPEGVSVSVGYDQRNINSRTADYEVDADTIPGQVVPLPVTAPAIDFKLTFAPDQQWEFFSAMLYANLTRRTS